MSDDSNEPLLSLEETNALLEAMRTGEDGFSEVESADLASPERPLRTALDRADACSRAVAFAVDKLMIRVTGTSTATEEQPAEIIPYKVVRSGLIPGSALSVLRTADGSFALLMVGPKMVSFLLDRRMGAPLTNEPKKETRVELSPLDRRVLLPFMISLAEILGQQWAEDPLAFKTDHVYTDAADLPPISMKDPMLQLSMRSSALAMASEQVMFALSAGAVGSTIPKKRAIASLAATSGDRRKMVDCIRSTRIRCVAVLGSTRCTVGHVLGIAQGDVLRLDGSPEQPIEVRVGDRTVLRGKPVVQSGNLAVQVAELARNR